MHKSCPTPKLKQLKFKQFGTSLQKKKMTAFLKMKSPQQLFPGMIRIGNLKKEKTTPPGVKKRQDPVDNQLSQGPKLIKREPSE